MQQDDSLELELSKVDFRLSGTGHLCEEAAGFACSARSFATHSRRAYRYAASEARLLQILPPVIPAGESWHVLSSGDVDSLSFVTHLVRECSLDYLALSTWCIAMPDVAQLGTWIDSGRVARLDAYVGEILPGSYPQEYAALCRLVETCGGRVAVFRNHSKVFLARSGHWAWVVESSANINTNPRTENHCITADMGLFLHHKAYFDSIRSFNRNFDAWTPAP